MVFLAIYAVIKGVLWTRCLLTSYKFEKDKLIIGKNQYDGPIDLKKAAAQAVGFETLISNITNRQIASVGSTISRFGTLTRKIKLNCNYNYVKEYFDTSYYKKKEFTNPRFAGETKYFIIFDTDTKMVKIPKIYPRLCKEPDTKPAGISRRILLRSTAVFMIALALSFADICVGASMNSTYKKNISYALEQIGEELSQYGYAQKETSENVFARNEGEHESQIKYWIDKTGHVEEISVSIYYSSASENAENEIRTILGTVDYNFDEKDVSEFISALKDSLDGDLSYYRLVSDDGKHIITISDFDGYIYVYGR